MKAKDNESSDGSSINDFDATVSPELILALDELTAPESIHSGTDNHGDLSSVEEQLINIRLYPVLGCVTPVRCLGAAIDGRRDP
jgi:hypothetical protein